MKTTFTLLLSCLASACFAQDMFKPGYVVHAPSDTIKCLINDKNWNQNPTTLEVKKDANAAITTLGLMDIVAFGIDGGDAYVTHTVDADMTSMDYHVLKNDPKPKIEQRTVMLRYLVRGAANLFHYKDEVNKDHFYISKGVEVPQELQYQMVVRAEDGTNQFAYRELYKGMLAVYFDDCDEAKNQSKNIGFNAKALSKVVQTYNACVSDEAADFVATEKRFRLGWGAVLSGGYTSYEFKKNPTPAHLLQSDFNGLSYGGGLFLNMAIPRGHGKVSVQNELLYKPYSMSSYYESYFSEERYQKYDMQLDLKYISLQNMVRYKFVNTKFSPFIGVGISNSLLVSSNSRKILRERLFSPETVTEKDLVESLSKSEQALLVGAGATYGKLGAELRFERGNGFSKRKPIATRTSTLFLLSYSFN
ncbi:hypothetical protein [Pontibacter anaerobius]|uniref:Outer membrane protein beta-barrel domain-containing protein n=1 Tax=Pontibacter anaerobius TaxID=2993940 RepID=A0ABT3RJS4_9BACT|nr:hypothetical protein [Pontibacter anaerobius]MCX2741628.1 hypothetical protein [Pontibacter anaerobius]